MKGPKTHALLLRQINAAMEKNVNNSLRGDGLTLAQMSMLLELYDMPDRTLSLKELEATLQLAQSTVAGIAARLEQKGFLEYCEVPGDKRVKRVRMTAAGEICSLRARGRVADAEREVIEDLSGAEQFHFLNLLNKVNEHLKSKAYD